VHQDSSTQKTQGLHKVASCDFSWYFSNAWRFLREMLYTTLLNSQMYTPTRSSVKIYYIGKWQNYAISTTTIPDFSAFRALSSVFTSSRLVALKRASFLVMRWGCRLGDWQGYCRCLEWPPFAFCSRFNYVWFCFCRPTTSHCAVFISFCKRMRSS